MSEILVALTATMVATAFLSGIFGMAGGLILMGILLVVLPLPEAMALHAVTQMSSNAWRGLLWIGHVHWRVAANFLLGCAFAVCVWLLWRWVPSNAVAFILLGVTPFLVKLLPVGWKPQPTRLLHGVVAGSACMSLMLLAGVSGPLINSYFLSGQLDRRAIVATKAVCQIFSHGAKLLCFAGLVDQATGLDPSMMGLAVAASILGTWMAKPVLEHLSDAQYRTWAARIITSIAIVYLLQGTHLMLRPLLGGWT